VRGMKAGMHNLRVVLVAVRNSLNIGAVARAMSNFGVMRLRVVNPYEKAWREAKSAIGAAQLLADADECATVAQAVADCSLVVGTTAVGNREVRQPLWSLPDAGPAIRKRLKASNVALLFGSEKRGLSNESLSYCHWLLRIPTVEAHRSMNLGQAVAVCLFELGRAQAKSSAETPTPRNKRRAEGFARKDTAEPRQGTEKAKAATRKKGGEEQTGRLRARMDTVERIADAWLRALDKSGYVAPRGQATAEEKLRRMLRRFALEQGDAEVFLGMVKKVLWKIEEQAQKARAKEGSREPFESGT
jgi:TrmH family RNA methyltransferase